MTIDPHGMTSCPNCGHEFTVASPCLLPLQPTQWTSGMTTDIGTAAASICPCCTDTGICTGDGIMRWYCVCPKGKQREHAANFDLPPTFSKAPNNA